MITVTINNYEGKNLTYTMPDDGDINIWTVSTIDSQGDYKLTNVNLELVHHDEIKIEEEKING